MQIKIKKDSTYTDKVIASDIHGKHPYKLYLQVFGNCVYGRFIVVVSNKQLNKREEVDSILVQLVSRLSVQNEADIRLQAQGLRPNSINSNIIKYKVKEVSILDVGNTPLIVFKPVK